MVVESLGGVGTGVGGCLIGFGTVGLGFGRTLIEVGSEVFGIAVGVGSEVVGLVATGAVVLSSALLTGLSAGGDGEVVHASDNIIVTRAGPNQEFMRRF